MKVLLVSTASRSPNEFYRPDSVDYAGMKKQMAEWMLYLGPYEYSIMEIRDIRSYRKIREFLGPIVALGPGAAHMLLTQNIPSITIPHPNPGRSKVWDAGHEPELLKNAREALAQFADPNIAAKAKIIRV